MKVSKSVVLEIVGRLGRATSRQVWGRLLSQGCVCKRKTVSVMLLRCSRQGLMMRKRKGRDFFYRLSDSGWRRLKYLKNAKNADSDIIKLPMRYGCWAMIEILTSSDPTLRSFSSFLIWLHKFHHVPPKKLVELSVEFLLSTRTINQPQLPQSAKFNRDLLTVWAIKRISDISDEEDYMQMQLLSKQASQPSEDVLKEFAETRIETDKLLREVIKVHFGRRNITKPAEESKSHFDKKLSETEPSISTSKRTSIKHSTATYQKVPSDYSVVPPPSIQPAILKLISKAKEIIVEARCKDISKDVIAGLEKASSQGVPVTVRTDNVEYIRERAGEEWVVEKKSNVRFPLFIGAGEGGIYEVLAVFFADEPAISFGVRTFERKRQKYA